MEPYDSNNGVFPGKNVRCRGISSYVIQPRDRSPDYPRLEISKYQYPNCGTVYRLPELCRMHIPRLYHVA